MSTEYTDISFKELKTKHVKDEGLVLLGCGGDPNEWFEGVGDTLKEEKIAPKGVESFGPFYRLESSKGRTDLVMMFNESPIEIGKMAIWRLRFGDNSWLSDFFVNYRSHYGA